MRDEAHIAMRRLSAAATAGPGLWGLVERATVRPQTNVWRLLGALAAALGLFLLYFLSFPDVYSDAYIFNHDSTVYLKMIEVGSLAWILHPHHLLYHVQPFALTKLLRALGAGPEASLWANRLVNAAYGAAGVLLFYRTAGRLAGARWPAAVGAAGLAASAAYWFHAALPESEAAAALGLTLVLWALARAVERSTDAAWAGVGLAHAYAALMRQDSLLAGPLMLLAAACATEGRARLRAAAAYLAALGGPLAVAYGAAYGLVIRPATGEPFLPWFGKHAVAYGDWGRLDLLTAENAWYVVQAFLQGVSPALGDPPLLLLVAVAVAVMTRELDPGALDRWRGWAAGCLGWFALRVAFYTWFDPTNTFMYGVGNLPAVWLVAALALAAARPTLRARVAGWGLVAAVAVGTVTGLVLPARGRVYAETAARWREATTPQDLILTSSYPLLLALLIGGREPVFLPRALAPYWSTLTDGQLREMIRARGRTGAVYATGEVDGRHETWSDLMAGPRGRFERRLPLRYGADRIPALLAEFRWTPVTVGSTTAGPVTGWVVTRRRDG